MSSLKIAIVGNGVLHYDMSRFIDACDVVIRFNDYNNYDHNTGLRTDVLCISNHGAPAQQCIDGALIKRAPFYDQLTEIWLPRSSRVHKGFVRITRHPSPQGETDELADEILQSNALEGKRVIRHSVGFNLAVFWKVYRHATRPFESPSTGLFAIEYVLGQPRFRRHEKYLFGFGFEGWRGHCWTAEKEIVMEYVQRGRLHLVPLSAETPEAW